MMLCLRHFVNDSQFQRVHQSNLFLNKPPKHRANSKPSLVLPRISKIPNNHQPHRPRTYHSSARMHASGLGVLSAPARIRSI